MISARVPDKFIGAVEDEWILFSDRSSDYTIGEPIGFGASSTVYAATYHPSPSPEDSHNLSIPIPCALKVLDLDSLSPRSLQLLQRETNLMSLSKHPNVLRVRGSWIDGHKIYIALRLMNKGSAADVMQFGWPGGMEEEVIRCILRQALQGLNYLHINGFIHRDVKAANLLIDDDGTVLLGDLGVAADLSEDSSHHVASSERSAIPRCSVTFQSKPALNKRKSFVGTPCWMAPELIAGKQYDSAADIWSFGITALELSQGRPPRSREPSKDVLLKIINETPPTLDRECGVHNYSRNFKDMIDSCLAKDPSKRPTAEQLLRTPFFRGAKKKGYLINTILKDLPPLTQRQQRRALRHPPTIATVDSWDFALTTHSLALFRRRQVDDLLMMTPERELICVYDDDESSGPHQGNRPFTSSSTSNVVISTGAAAEGSPINTFSFSESLQNPELPKSNSAHPTYLSRNGELIKRSFWSKPSSGVKRPSVSKAMVGNFKCSGDIGQSPFLLSKAQERKLSGRLDSNQDKRMKHFASANLEVNRESKSGSSSWPSISHMQLRGESRRDKCIVINDYDSTKPRSLRASILGSIIEDTKRRLSKL